MGPHNILLQLEHGIEANVMKLLGHLVIQYYHFHAHQLRMGGCQPAYFFEWEYGIDNTYQ